MLILNNESFGAILNNSLLLFVETNIFYEGVL